MPSRRTFLAATGTGLVGALAGCSETATPDEPPTPAPADAPAQNPEDHIFGATGDWSSYGCNAGNTRAVDDGRAPVDGLTERWRAPVGGLGVGEPVVAGDRVFLRRGDEVVAHDAVDGTELWRATGRTTPLVRDGTVYLGRAGALVALDAADGTEAWRLELDTLGTVGTPATHGGDFLFVPAGERLHRVDLDTRSVAWSRRLFGRVVGPVAFYRAAIVLAVTEAGELYGLGIDGTGWGRWQLGSQPQAPPTVDSDGVYVNCLDGNVHGVGFESSPRLDVDWTAETGWANGGLATDRYLYAAGTRGLTAVDPEDGSVRWRHDTGGWRHTAPALGRDTLFCGGNGALSAFDPTPSGPGPALRFERSFAGRVNAPVLDDGSLYVVAETGTEEWHLLAFE